MDEILLFFVDVFCVELPYSSLVCISTNVSLVIITSLTIVLNAFLDIN